MYNLVWFARAGGAIDVVREFVLSGLLPVYQMLI